MALQVSNGYKARILGPEAFEGVFALASIEVYSGIQPANAEMPPTGVLLGRVTINAVPWSGLNPASGLTFERVGAYINKPFGDNWLLSIGTSGAAGWWRLLTPTDTGEYSNDDARVDGTIGLTGTEWIVPNTAMLAGTTIALEAFFLTIPPVV